MRRGRITATIAALVAAASLAAGAQATQPSSAAVAAPHWCDDEWGCGMNHNDVMAGAIWGEQ